MFNRRLLRSTLVVLALVAVSVAPTVQPLAQEEMMPPMGPPEALKKCEYLIGDWSVAVEYRMGPDTPWQQSEGKASISYVLNDCAIRQDFTGEFMGMNMTGMEILTFNRETDRFESVWVDDMGARMSISAGNFEGDKLVMTGEEMQMGQKVKMRNVGWSEDEDLHFMMEMSSDEGQTWFEAMRFVYTRTD